MASGDGFQATAEENVAVHHYANVLFNVLRGGIFDDQYNVSSWDFVARSGTSIATCTNATGSCLTALPDTLTSASCWRPSGKQDDPQLERLCHEYLPITFGRRHGDPSRPGISSPSS